MPIRHVVLALFIANAALAQERPFAAAVPDVRPSMRVRARLAADKQWQVGYVESVDSTTLALTVKGTASTVRLDIALSDLTALERGVVHQKARFGVVGLLAGFTGGVLLGGVAGAVFGESNPEDGKLPAVAGFGFVGGLVGSVIGVVVALEQAPVEWIPVRAARR